MALSIATLHCCNTLANVATCHIRSTFFSTALFLSNASCKSARTRTHFGDPGNGHRYSIVSAIVVYDLPKENKKQPHSPIPYMHIFTHARR